MSKPLPKLTQQYLMTKLYLVKDYGFLDEATRAHHDATFADFKLRTPWDVHQSFTNSLTIEGFKERTLCYIDDAGPPEWVNLWCYILVSIFSFSVVYRMALDRIVATMNHDIYKSIGQ